MKSQPPINLPAVAVSFLSNYYESDQLSQLFNKVSSSANFLNNNLFNSGTTSDLDLLFNSANQIKVEPQMQITDPGQLDGLMPKKSPKNSSKKDGKLKKLHCCPHCNFSTIMSQHVSIFL
jgi:hypothetical protein